MDNSEQDVISRLESMLRRVIREELDRPKQKLSTGSRPRRVKFENGGFVVDQALADCWSKTYGAATVAAELLKAASWCESNRAKAPKSRYDRFLNAWLARAAKSEQKRPEAACAHCSGSLAAGSTSSHVGLICNPCWDAYMSGQWR